MSGFQVYACGMAGVVLGALAGIATTPSPNAGQQVVVAREIHEFSSTSIQMGAAAGIFLWHHYLFVPDIMEKRVLRIDRNTGIWLMWDGKVPVRASFDVPEPSVS
jgi:hypothetical protein